MAVTSGYRAARQREQPAGGFLPDSSQPAELPEPAPPGAELSDQVAHRLDARQRLQALTGRERHYLALQAVGLNYAEIADREQATPRTVERQLLRARHKLRGGPH